MAASPLLIGITHAGAHPIHILLAAAWLAAFLAFNVVEVWAKTPVRRRKPVHLALLSHTSVTCVLGLALVIVRPALLSWAWLYLPLAAATIGLIFRRQERALVTRALSIVISCLVAPVAASLSVGGGAFTDVVPHSLSGGDQGVRIWTSTAILVLYFFGTVLFVRSMIRGRGDIRWARASIIYHIASGLLVGGCMVGLDLPLGIGAVWVVLIIRAWVFPVAQRSRKPFKPIVLGLSETLWCAVLTAVLIVG